MENLHLASTEVIDEVVDSDSMFSIENYVRVIM